jgi:hypothetical protein
MNEMQYLVGSALLATVIGLGTIGFSDLWMRLDYIAPVLAIIAALTVHFSIVQKAGSVIKPH